VSLDLFIVRPGVYPERYLGHLVTVPDVPAPAVPGSIPGQGTKPPTDAGLDALFASSLVGVGKPARLVPYGLVEPTAWERRFVAWASRHLGLEPESGWDTLASERRNPSFESLAAALADPLAPPPSASVDLSLVACDDPELEAIAAARRIRAWLAREPFERWPEALDDVLVLLPASPERRSTWKRVLEKHGLAADVPAYLPVAGLPLGRWLLSLCRLARFAEEPVHRDDLREALLAPFVRMPKGARRSDLRECLRSLRGHRVHLGLWREHLAQWEERKRQETLDRGLAEDEQAGALRDLERRRQGLDELTGAVARRLAEPGALFEGLRALLDELGAAERVRASGVDQAASALERTRRVLGRLAEDEKARARFPYDEKVGELERSLGSALVRTAPPLRHGVRIASYAQYDGRAARFLVLAGLEEGGYPRTAARPSHDEAELAARLGLGTPEDELLRQARVAAAAAGKAREAVLLAWSRVDEAGGDTFAGPLLAAVRKREGHDGIAEERFGDAQANPPDEGAVASPADVLASTVASVGDALPQGPFRAAWERARAAAAHARLLDAERAPTEESPVGPYAGKVGVSLAAKKYSPTALEQLGQCPSRYFLERVLGVEEAGDEGVDLDPMETGSMLHEALALAAQKAIRARGAWSLGASGTEREEGIESLGGELAKELEGAARRYLDSHPTLPEPLVLRVVERWRRVLESWLEKENAKPEGGLFPRGAKPEPSSLSEKELKAIAAADPRVAEALDAFRKLELEEALALLDGARAAVAPSAAEAGRTWGGSKAVGLVTRGAFQLAATNKSKTARGKALDALAEEARARYGKKESELREALWKAWARDRLSVPPRAVASEWSFGDAVRDGADPRSTEEPLTIDLPGGGRLAVRGRVDRVDAARDRPDAAVVDYKSGRSKSGTELVKELGEGRHLQLPLYALAVEKLLASELHEPLHVVRGRLDFLRSQAQPEITFEPGLQPELRPEGKPQAEPVGIQEVVLEHLAHSVRLLEAGSVPLLPRACPNESPSARCPCNVVCDYRPEAREKFNPSDTQPLFVPPGKERGAKVGGEDGRRLAYQPADPVEDPPASKRALEAHERGRALACDTRRDVVVSAGAGSGKTRALVARYAAAIGPGCGPENILCITFTRKATAEMRARIRERILDTDRSVEREALRAWITALGAAPIQTIDAFAARVVADLGGEELDLSAGSGSFATEYVAERMAREAKRPSAALDLLLSELPVPQVRAVLASLMEEAALGKVVGTAEEIAQGWNEEAERLAGDLPERLSRFVGRAANAAKRDPDLRDAIEEQLSELEGAVAAFQSHQAIAGLRALEGIALPRKKVAEPVKEELRALRDGPTAAWFKGSMGVLSGCESPKDVAAQVLREAKVAHAALETARSWLEGYARARGERRISSFADVLARATKVLAGKEPSEVQARFPYLHILVDEFQDTDEAQLGFIRLLQEKLGQAGRRPALFAVGDPKQSIYRFRGAEVDQFEEYWDAAPESSRAVLAVCWRAEPALSIAISRLFGRLFDAKLDPAAKVPWEPLAPRGEPGEEPCVELILPDDLDVAPERVPDAEGGEPVGEEGEVSEDEGTERALVRRIREILAESDRSGEESPVAVLTHSWARAVHYGKLLREHGVPAFVQGGRGLLDAPEVRHLFHWLEALERQDDDLVFAALLRGATVGVSDPGLYAIRRGYGLELRDFGAPDGYVAAKGRNALSSIRHGFRFDGSAAADAMEKEAGRPIDAEVRAALRRDEGRLLAFGEAWAAAARLFGLVPLAAVVEAIVGATGYEAVLRGRPDGLQALANLRSFQELVRAAEAGRSPADGVREIERISAVGEDPAAGGLSLEPGAAVTVTVVHQAKGREWDTVVVPDLERVEVKGRVARCDLQRLVRRQGRKWERRYLPGSLLENPDDLLATLGGVGAKVLAAATAGVERAESRRLFYVACTRAKKRLVLTGRWPDEKAFAKRAGEGEVGLPDADSWLEDLVFALEMRPGSEGRPVPEGVWREGRDFRWVRPRGEGFGESVRALPDRAKVNPAVVRLAALGVPPVPLVVVNPSGAEASGPVPTPSISQPATAPPGRDDSPFASAADEGTAFHRAVQLWSYLGDCSDSLVEQAVRDVAGDFRLPERAARVKELLLAQASCQPALLAELAKAAERGDVFHEVSVGYLRADGAWVEGVIDLLYRDGARQWHIVDYKTDRAKDASAVEGKVREYYPQVRAYAEAVKGELPGGASVKSFRLWLVGMGVVASWEA